ncbi:MAG TPA: lysylphosphatidylglycerol synthase domain-containing protein [Pengzhenrongella sp.]
MTPRLGSDGTRAGLADRDVTNSSTPVEAPERARTTTWRLVAGVCFFAVAAWYAVVTLRSRWSEVADSLAGIGIGRVVAATLVAAAALYLMSEQWLAILRALGLRPPRARSHRLFLVSQLGKYLPGSGWAYAAQVELFRGARRSTAFVAVLISVLLDVLVAIGLGGMVVAAGAEHALPSALAWSLTVVGLGGLGAVFVAPRSLGAAVRLVSRLLRRAAAPDPLDPGAVRAAILVTIASWLLFGGHLWILLGGVPTGTTALHTLALAVTGFALAWVVGFVVVIAPAGLGVREAVLVGVLGSVLSAGAALALALVSRFAMVAADVLLAVGALSVAGITGRRGNVVPVEMSPRPTTGAGA